MRLPEYHTYTANFQKAVQELVGAGAQRDQRAALSAYNAVVGSCVECHRYVGRARIADARQPR